MKRFTAKCRRCSRLAEFLDQVAEEYPDYHAAPVAPFGDAQAKLLIVGLAPGMHGANATGRPFTGDHAGVLLYQTLYDYGFSNQPESTSRRDGLELYNCRITNAVKCLPPQNKPLGAEVNQCNDFLAQELSAMPAESVVIALGSIAHKAVIKALQLRQKDYPFAHAMEHQLSDQLNLIDSYHCSRYNTQTRRLTAEMFQQIFQRAGELLK
ncbi:MAG: uracil-DNA glycosylase [Candidatus Thiodiazotropha lotti]|uniref:Type-5 uracil-DNA glycosylase n=1 Tax=Candidatus Thiodiazotropha endoloripes TaxID=1818881 RepID=A0A1E2UUR1_9GAMM|nr:uracil-DNA glycosylase [Candidatus Thiodiazotropha endoloripes]MCG7897334.1 uracil-DNA glycosylase [Candidatus Thiodiazotropha weberae]MCG7991049.1 uracil-DNA glycosylase [Candidatus Thiodiazotropha lotti]MCG7902759.1 uracil-DNA glycosylase [Candidatus Thiodiazotropha weberae]MCG8001259.1 uracil-DNA glycosylase [Candidatus Thiodiazotropha lotti]MCW4182704.1 uracil-DNA glycosylase [Candidatus Thiodiazotropha weberae]